MSQPKLSIVLPCYNEGATLHQLMAGYRDALAGIDSIEVVLVDNGSTDDTAKRIEAEAAKPNPVGHCPFRLQAVHVPVNQGYGHGILAGLAQASGEYLAWTHADLQCSPKDVVRLYEALMQQPHPERCFGKGFRVNKQQGRASIQTKLHTLLSNLVLGFDLKEINAQPKLFHRDFLKEFKSPPKGFELDVYACAKAVRKKLDFVTIEVYFHPRQAGKSKWAYSFTSKVRFIITNFLYLCKLRLLAGRI